MRQSLESITVIDIGATIVLAVAVVVAVAHLQVSSVGNRFAVGQLSLYAIVLGRGVVVSVVLLFSSQSVVGDVGSRQLLALAIAVVSADAQGDVASFFVQFAIGLQFSAEVAIGAIAHVAIGVGVYHDVRQFVEESVVWIVTVGPRCTVSPASVARIGEVGTEDDVGHCVGLPFQTEIAGDTLV